ncbi:hypothetical protein PPL_06002 [Heterostelium album PN500]|uniref:Uncharacterized protein n=1 Tax=Heterostelium pallidum (strain ATCC 26659 / Pp 5 / PN500) TaxID=670386 RepID=D3BBY2_HETP5|nr:hypothetical protein PPL_06002 [Heterostelium album PN500]EFA81165.1 hypothetical protein PPL_06002 [Heterostelium album PN500]|eukprot:XP_020433283.1 hypothetical protein PPL_06002 [Heterostelium album PN500]
METESLDVQCRTIAYTPVTGSRDGSGSCRDADVLVLTMLISEFCAEL